MAVTKLQKTAVDIENLVLKAKLRALRWENHALKVAAAWAKKAGSLRPRKDSTYGSLSSSCSDLLAQDNVDDRTYLISQDEESSPEVPSNGQSASTSAWNDWTAVQPNWVDPEESAPSAFPDPFSSAEPGRVDDESTALGKLAQETRLTDRDFYRCQASHAGISLAAQQDLMEEARWQARQALYDALGKYWPEGQAKHYFHGPISVRFGREELASTIGCEGPKRIAEGLANGTSVIQIDSPLSDTIALRNALSHQEWSSSSRVDQLLQYAQAFVCSLADEERALEIRAIRDRLKQQTQESFDQLKQCQPLTTAPDPHHQEVFYIVANALEEAWREQELTEMYGADVVRLAREWAQRYRKPGRERSDFVASSSNNQASAVEAAH